MNKKGSKYLDLVKQIKKDFPVSNYGSEKTAKAIWAAKVKTAIAKMNVKKSEDMSGSNPMGVKTDIDFDDLRSDAVSIIENNKKGRLLVSQFVRPGKKKLSKTITDIAAGKVYKKYERNIPVGALVAFLTDGKLLMGWSKYNKAKESLPFSKRTAVLTGIMRGLIDGIHPNGLDSYVTDNGSHIPKVIAKDITSFVKRVEKYFGQQITNVERFQGTG